jgi:cyclic beta-1,2-glucan synthetase
MYRVGIEGILGITLARGALRIDPCIPRTWPGFEATVRLPLEGDRLAEYHTVVENPGGVSRGVARIEVDGAIREDALIAIAEGRHQVRVVMGSDSTIESGG